MLEREIALNYPDGSKQKAARAAEPQGAMVQLQKGMTFQEVRSLLGAPSAETEWGNQTRWAIPT